MAAAESLREKLAWVLIRHGRVLMTRNHGRELFYFPGGMREPGGSDAELAWFSYADRPRVSPADQLVFDTLHSAGQLA